MPSVMICGASGGLGLACVAAFLKKGYTVFALDILKNENKSENLYSIQCDFTDDESIRNAIDFVSAKTDKLDVVVYIAGIVKLGSLVETPVSAMEASMNINLFGMYRICRATFELVRRAKGRYVNISSEYGKICAVPFHGFYTASKHAVEMYCDSLRREMVYHGIKVITIRPGAFKTPMQNGITKQFETLTGETRYYKPSLMKMQKLMQNELKRASDPQKAAKIVYRAASVKSPRKIYRINNSLKMKLLSALPYGLQDLLLSLFLK